VVAGEQGQESGRGRATPGPVPPDLLRGAGRAGLVDRLERWVAEARVDQAALERSRERWLREVADQEATFAGTLLDLGERGAAVTVRTRAGRAHHGAVEVVGAGFVALRLRRGAVALVRMEAINVVRTAPAEDLVLGDRTVRSELRLDDVLRELAADRERVLLVAGDGADVVSGELRAVGLDVAVVRSEGPPSSVYVPLGAITEVTVG
jgi:hypothetical protein